MENCCLWGLRGGPLSLGFPRAPCQPVWPHREMDNGPPGPSGSGFLIPVAPGSDHTLVPGSLGSRMRTVSRPPTGIRLRWEKGLHRRLPGRGRLPALGSRLPCPTLAPRWDPPGVFRWCELRLVPRCCHCGVEVLSAGEGPPGGETVGHGAAWGRVALGGEPGSGRQGVPRSHLRWPPSPESRGLLI